MNVLDKKSATHLLPRDLLWCATLLAIALCGWHKPASAGVENPDLTFNLNNPDGQSGWRADYLSNYTVNEETVAVTQTSDGAYLMAGRYQDPNGVAGANSWDIALMKYQTDGTPAAGFGSNQALGSMSRAWMTHDAGLTDLTDMTLDAQGRIVVVGSTPFGGVGSNFGIARFLADGSGPDLSFNGQGGTSIAFDYGGNSTDTPVAVLTDSLGGIVVLGSVSGATNFSHPFSHREVALTRVLGTNGSLDFGFGNDSGRSHYFLDPDQDAVPVGFVHAAGGYVVAATANISFSQTAMVAMYFDASGILRHHLVIALAGVSNNMQAAAIAVVPESDSLIIAGNIQQSPAQSAVACRISIDVNGVLAQDYSFGPTLSSCYVSTDVDVVQSVAVHSDRSVVLVGEKKYPNGITDGTITRLFPNGTLDNFFANARSATHLKSLSWNTHFSRVMLDHDRPVVIGYRADSDTQDSDHDFSVVRFQSDLIFASTFGK